MTLVESGDAGRPAWWSWARRHGSPVAVTIACGSVPPGTTHDYVIRQAGPSILSRSGRGSLGPPSPQRGLGRGPVDWAARSPRPALERRRRLAVTARPRPPRLPPGVTTFHETHQLSHLPLSENIAGPARRAAARPDKAPGAPRPGSRNHGRPEQPSPAGGWPWGPPPFRWLRWCNFWRRTSPNLGRRPAPNHAERRRTPGPAPRPAMKRPRRPSTREPAPSSRARGRSNP